MPRRNDRWSTKSKLHVGPVNLFTIHVEFRKGCSSSKKKDIMEELKNIFYLQREWVDELFVGLTLYGGVFCKSFYFSIRDELKAYIKEEMLGGDLTKFSITLNVALSPYVHSHPKGLGRFIGWGTHVDELPTKLEEEGDFKWAEGHDFVFGTTSNLIVKEIIEEGGGKEGDFL